MDVNFDQLFILRNSFLGTCFKRHSDVSSTRLHYANSTTVTFEELLLSLLCHWISFQKQWETRTSGLTYILKLQSHLWMSEHSSNFSDKLPTEFLCSLLTACTHVYRTASSADSKQTGQDIPTAIYLWLSQFNPILDSSIQFISSELVI